MSAVRRSDRVSAVDGRSIETLAPLIASNENLPQVSLRCRVVQAMRSSPLEMLLARTSLVVLKCRRASRHSKVSVLLTRRLRYLLHSTPSDLQVKHSAGRVWSHAVTQTKPLALPPLFKRTSLLTVCHCFVVACVNMILFIVFLISSFILLPYSHA